MISPKMEMVQHLKEFVRIVGYVERKTGKNKVLQL